MTSTNEMESQNPPPVEMAESDDAAQQARISDSIPMQGIEHEEVSASSPDLARHNAPTVNPAVSTSGENSERDNSERSSPPIQLLVSTTPLTDDARVSSLTVERVDSSTRRANVTRKLALLASKGPSSYYSPSDNSSDDSMQSSTSSMTNDTTPSSSDSDEFPLVTLYHNKTTESQVDRAKVQEPRPTAPPARQLAGRSAPIAIPKPIRPRAPARSDDDTPPSDTGPTKAKRSRRSTGPKQ